LSTLSTSFFEHQERAKRNTTVLVVLMALGVLGMALAIYVLLVYVGPLLGLHSQADGPSFAWFQPRLLLTALIGVALTVVVASSSRVLTLRGGGAQIAEMLGGRLVSGNPRDVLEKRLVNVVEEMAIASGVPVPQVFVLEGEVGINAFAAGFALEDAAIAVTRGSLEKLTRDELQGVIAHEFSHVLNGDMRLNIHLMGIVFGIVCIGLLGRLMLRAGSGARYSSRRDRGGAAAAFFLIGLGVLVIGLIGELFGKLIKAAVSRQREFLADASAVQFTRNPLGIAGALKKIGGYDAGATIAASHAEEASHFFFGDIHLRRLFSGGLLATHPPLAERVRRIDPSFRGEFPAVGPGVAEPDESPARGFASGAGAAPRGSAAPGQVAARAASADAVDPSHGRALLAELPAALRGAASHAFSAGPLVYAMLLSDQANIAQRQYDVIRTEASPELLTETLRLSPAIAGLGRRERLVLVELLAPALRELSREQRAAFSSTVKGLVAADDAVSIFEYVVGQTLSERMDEAQPAARARTRFHSLRAVADELSHLLSLLAHAGAADAEGAERAFAAAAQRLPEVQLRLLPQSERLLSGLGGALQSLRALSPRLSAQVVDACAHAVQADRRVTEDEVTLLHAVCGALGVPMPV
jgi:Zn-dependent protease with chaperone function